MTSSRERVLARRMAVRTLRGAARIYWRNRTLPAWRQLAVFAYRRLRGRPVPTTAFIGVTHRCQLRCPHCYAAAESRGFSDEMSTAEVKDVLGQIRALGALQVVFTGGEPLLREDIFELVAHAHRLGLVTRLNSNGGLLTAARAVELKRRGLDKCGISIDNAGPEAHDRLRGSPGAFAQAVRALGHLRRLGIERQILAYSSHDKLTGELERIHALGERLGVSSVFFTIPYLSGRWQDSYQEAFSDDDMARLRELLRLPLAAMEFPRAGKACDAYAYAILHVNPRGEVTTCPAVPYVLGNLRREPLADIWGRLTAARPFAFRGRCPMSRASDRERLRRHAAGLIRGSSKDGAPERES